LDNFSSVLIFETKYLPYLKGEKKWDEKTIPEMKDMDAMTKLQLEDFLRSCTIADGDHRRLVSQIIKTKHG
jgi:hypothetical protein